MARLAAALKLGFYPLPEQHGPSLRARLAFPDPKTPATALDPCCGAGAALKAITSDSGTAIYGVEVDTDRAKASRQAGIDVIQGSAFDVRGRAGRLSLLYLNPPYDFEIGPLANKRMETLFLSHTYTWLKPKGVLIMVIPGRAISSVARNLSTHFHQIRIYRMEGELSRKYDQYAIFAVRHHNNGKDASEILEHVYKSVDYLASLPTLTTTPDVIYSVPPGGEVQLTYTGIPLDEIEDLMPASSAWRNARALLVPRQEVAGGHPITPLHGGHVGLLATAGMLNGVFGEGVSRHIARWRPIKHSITSVEHEDGKVIERTRERFSNELALVFASGKTQILTETRSSLEIEDASPSVEATPEPESLTEKTADKPEAKFATGRLTMTPGIQKLMIETGVDFSCLLKRHVSGDWGDVLEPDRKHNEEVAARSKGRIFSSYSVSEVPGRLVWIITEADRSVTTIALPPEY